MRGLTNSRIACAVVLSLTAFWSLLPRSYGATAAEIDAFISKIEGSDAETRHQAFENAAELGAEAVEPIGRLLGSRDKAVSRAARIALEKIVGHATRPGAESDRRDTSEALLKLVEPTYPVSVRNCALELLGVAGGDEAVPTLSRLLGDPEVFEMARWALERIPGVAAGRALTDAIERTRMICQRVALIKTLGVKRCSEAVPVLLKQSRDPNLVVRVEAVDALARIGDAAAEPAILAALGSDIVSESNRAFDAYLRLAEAQISAEPDEALRMYHNALELAVTDAERCAAVVGIGRTGVTRSVNELIGFLTDPNPAVRDVAAQGLVNMPARDTTQMVIRRLRGATPPLKSLLLRVVAARGGPESAAAVRNALDDPSAEVRTTALELSGKLEDFSAEATLLEAAQTGSEMIRPTALSAYIRLADARFKRGETARALDMYHRALDISEHNAEQKLALQGIATIGDPSSLPRVTAMLDKPGVAAEAIVAYLSIADTLGAAGKRREAIKIYNDVFDRTSSRSLATRAAAGLRKLGVKLDVAQRSGFITDWFLVGPFPNMEKAAYNTVYFPEKEIKLDGEYEVGGREMRWKHHHTDDPQGIVDLDELFDPHDNVAAYAYATVDSERTLPVTIKIGSDDGVVCWLNGERIHGTDASRGLSVDQDSAKAELLPGTNRILVKILQGGGDWGFCLRIAFRNNRPVPLEQTGPGAFKAKR